MKNFIPRQITPQTLRALSRQFSDSKIDSSVFEKAKQRLESMIKKLEASGAMPSVRQSLESHFKMSVLKKDVKQSYLREYDIVVNAEGGRKKVYAYGDPFSELGRVSEEGDRTVQVAKKIIQEHCDARGMGAEEQDYLQDIVIGNHGVWDPGFQTDMPNGGRKGTVNIGIWPIERYPEYKKAYEEYLAKGQRTIMAVGGPAAEDQALLVTLLKMAGILDKSVTNIFASAGYQKTNQVNSAAQVHARHGNALNADDALTGHALIGTLLKRGMINIVYGNSSETLDALENPGYRKIHVKLTLDPQKIKIYLLNEFNWLKQKFKKEFLGKDQHDLNRVESVISAEIMKVMQEYLKSEGVDFKMLESTQRDTAVDSSSIHVALTEKEKQETIAENEHLKQIDILSVELDEEQIKKLFAGNEKILGAFSYPGDGHIPWTVHKDIGQVVSDAGGEWLEPATVRGIFIDKKDGVPTLAGVEVHDGGGDVKAGNESSKLFADSKVAFIPLSEMHLTAGYQSNLRFVEEDYSTRRALSNSLTTATGVSINVILKRNEAINNFIEKFGNTGQLAVTNSHWTAVAIGKDEVIVRVTGGGNTGSEHYNPNYFLNTIANTNTIFQDALIGVISTYGCPRAINAINSTQFEEIAKGLIVSYGKGGTGNTKRSAEAVIGLALLGYEEQLVEFFSRYKDYKGENMGEVIREMVREFKSEGEFFTDAKERTKAILFPDERVREIVAKHRWGDLSPLFDSKNYKSLGADGKELTDRVEAPRGSVLQEREGVDKKR